MSADLEANPPDEISRESERYGSASEVARDSHRLPEEREEQVTVAPSIDRGREQRRGGRT
jgi:hypothetical protein